MDITFNNPNTDPAAFQSEWEEWNQTVENNTPPEEPEVVPEIDFFDFCKQHAEAEQ